MAGGETTARNMTRVLALSLALFFAVFLTQVVAHSHQDGQNEATCQVCQAAHIAPAPIAATLATHSLIAIEYVRTYSIAFHQEFFFHDSPSRAPPSPSL
jgi:hypothetical protein